MSDLNLIIILMLIKFPVSSTPEYSKFIEHIDDVVEIRLRCMVKIENFTHYYFKKKKKERNLNSNIANVLWHNSKIFIHSHVDRKVLNNQQCQNTTGTLSKDYHYL